MREFVTRYRRPFRQLPTTLFPCTEIVEPDTRVELATSTFERLRTTN